VLVRNMTHEATEADKAGQPSAAAS
jgi:hypothetical protein